MKRYLEYYENVWPENIAELTAVENKPFVGYLKGGGVKYTVIPKPQPDNEIWYTSIDGNIVTPFDTTVFGANIVSNTYEDGKGVITFDGDVMNVGYNAFEGCSSLKSIVIPDSVTSIDVFAFLECSSLTSITIPNSVTIIEDGAFEDCSSLTSVTIPNSVTHIGYYVFEGCSSLTSITIPESVTSIGDRNFYGCKSLTSIIFEGTMEQWNAIAKGEDWNYNVPATYVQCSDGQVAL